MVAGLPARRAAAALERAARRHGPRRPPTGTSVLRRGVQLRAPGLRPPPPGSAWNHGHRADLREVSKPSARKTPIRPRLHLQLLPDARLHSADQDGLGRPDGPLPLASGPRLATSLPLHIS